MKQKPIFKLVSVVLLLVLASCDPGVSYTKIIQNDSGFDIWVKSNDSIINGLYDKFDSIVVFKHSESTLYIYTGLGQTTEFENCDFFNVTLYSGICGNDSLEITIDLNDKSNWQFSIFDESFKHGGTCECRLIIDDEMVE